MATTKRIIERNLTLDQAYNLIDTKYISLIDGTGCACDNCGKLIANIATVKGEVDSKTYSIGFDCLETFLINNQLLKGEDIEKYTEVKKSMPKIKKVKEYLKDFLKSNPFIDRVVIEFQYNSWITYNFFVGEKQRWNDGEKFKTLYIPTLKASLESIKNVKIEYK